MEGTGQEAGDARSRKFRRLLLSTIPFSLGMWFAILGLLLKILS